MSLAPDINPAPILPPHCLMPMVALAYHSFSAFSCFIKCLLYPPIHLIRYFWQDLYLGLVNGVLCYLFLATAHCLINLGKEGRGHRYLRWGSRNCSPKSGKLSSLYLCNQLQEHSVPALPLLLSLMQMWHSAANFHFKYSLFFMRRALACFGYGGPIVFFCSYRLRRLKALPMLI